MRFRDIPQMTRDGSYRVNIGWGYIEKWLVDCNGRWGVDLDPPFQRAHVWDEERDLRRENSGGLWLATQQKACDNLAEKVAKFTGLKVEYPDC